MATMYVGGGLYLPTTGTASKTSTPTGGTVTVAQRNAIASAPKSTPVASSVTKKATTTTAKPTTNTLSTMAGSSLGTTSTKPKTVSPTASLVTGSSSAAVPRNTAAQNAAVASLLSGAGTRSTGGINAALPQPPQLTKAQIGNRFTQSLASGASTGAAVPNPAGLTRDEADTLRSRFYTQFYSGQPVQRIADKPVPVSYDYMLGPRNDDRPYVSPYDAARYGTVTPGPDQLPSNQFAGSLNGGVPLLDTTASNIAATLGGAGNALFGTGYGMIVGAGKALQGGPMVQNFGEGFVQGEGDVRQLLDQIGLDPSLNPRLAGNAADIVNVGSFAGMLPGVGAAMRTAAMRAGAGIPRTAAVIPQAAGIDAALTPRQAQFRQLMDSLNADSVARLPADDLDALLSRAVQEGMDAPSPPAAAAGTAKPVLSPREEYVRDFVETWGELPPANDDYFGPTAARSLYGKERLSDPLSEGSMARIESLSTPMEGIYPYARRGRTPGGYDDMLYSAVEDALGVGPTVARAEQLAPRPASTGGNAATGGNAFSDIIDAYDAEQLARAAKPNELFPDINPAATISDPADVFGPRLPAAAPQRLTQSDLDLIGPQRPDFMFPDEAADIIRRGGPRVDATPPRFTPTAAGVRSIVGAGAGIPLALLPFADLPSGGGIDTVAPTSDLISRPVTTVKIDPVTGQPVPARAPAPVSNETLNAFANSRGSMSTRLPGGAGQVLIPTKDGTVILPAPEEVAPAVDPEDIAKVLPADTSLTGPMAEAALADFLDPENQAQLDAAVNRPEESEFGSDTRFPSGPAGDEAATATPAAGTKFTPGPGQFVGSNGYIYEQSSDGSFERVGKVPGYTPAQLSEAANKGAFRDPNNIVTGGAKPRKQVRKKKEGEETFFDKAGNILKERFDDSVYGKLSKLFFPDDAAAGEAAAGPEAVEYYSTPQSSYSESLGVTNNSSNNTGSGTGGTGGTGTGTGGTGTGTGGTGTSPYTPEMQAMLDALYGNYMRQYNGPGVGYVPGVDPERNYFTPAFADGGLVDGRLVLGDGGPKEDKIPAMIDGVEQAKLSNGEFVMTAAAVKNAGGGDIELGAKRLMDLNNMLSYGTPAEQLKVQHVK